MHVLRRSRRFLELLHISAAKMEEYTTHIVRGTASLVPTHAHYVLPRKGLDSWTYSRAHCGESIHNTWQAVELDILYVLTIPELGYMTDIIRFNRFQYHRVGDCRYPCSTLASDKPSSAEHDNPAISITP